MPKLVIRSRKGTLFTVQLTTRPIKLGRADSCDVVLRDDGEVSREHAQLWVDADGRVLVADMNSKNGTRVDDGETFHNATRVAHHSIRVGEHEIEIVADRPATAPAQAGATFAPDGPATGDTRFFPSSKRLDLNQQRLALLISLTERIGGAFERKQLLEQALNACCESLAFERGLIALKTPRGDTELPVTRDVQRDETGAYKISRTLINRALIRGERAIVNNPATDLVGNLSDSLVRYPICSALCVPIMNRDEILGVIYGDRVTRASAYGPADVDFLAAIAQQVGVGLANLRLLREHVQSQRIFAELERARLIQENLLPRTPLHAGRVHVEGYNQPSSTVSGDYYDYFDLGDGRLGIIIADVTGHGLPAALLMANLQAAVNVALTSRSDLRELAARVNGLICRNTSSHVFITAILGTVDTTTGLIEYVSAGHPAPVLLGKQRLTIPDEDNSLPLGIDPEESYVVRRVDPGEHIDAVLLYTDGVVEACDREGRMLGLSPVVNALSALPEPTPPMLIRTALSVVRQHLNDTPNADDLALLAIQFIR